MMIPVVASVDIKKNVKIFIRVFIGCLSVIKNTTIRDATIAINKYSFVIMIIILS